MNQVAAALAAAINRHQAGQLDEAERQYRAILAQDDRQPDAWHLLGLIDYARGDYRQAVAQISRAILLDGGQASFHNHLGEALLAAGQLAAAETSCRRALTLDGTSAICHNTLGTVLAARGAYGDAVACYRQAIALAPQLAQAHYNLALALESQGDLAAAEPSLRRAVDLAPNYGRALEALAAMLQRQRRFEEAVSLYRRVLELDPRNAAAYCNLASALKDLDRTDDALAGYAQALQIDPQLAEAHYNQAVIHQSRAKFDEAEAAYRRAIDIRPTYATALVNLGTICKSQARFDEAMDCYDRALALDDDLAEGHRNRALLHLLRGNFTTGWPEYEWRRRVPGVQRTEFDRPQWTGEPIPGQTLLLIAEQGLGDTLQFVRYAKLIKQRSAARVWLHCPERLHALLRTTDGIDELLSGSVTQSFDCVLPLVSAPAVFHTTLEGVPADVPYLAAGAELIARWQRELASETAFKIGITWQGNPAYEDDHRRSVPLAEFAPLADCDGVRLYSLQKQHGLAELAELADRMKIVDLGRRLDEGESAFVDTAAVMKNMDLIVTSDTATAHLAGALAVPVWVLLADVPDWRWLLQRDNSPWYPTMRLFRQTKRGDWSEVMARVAAALASLIGDSPAGRASRKSAR